MYASSAPRAGGRASRDRLSSYHEDFGPASTYLAGNCANCTFTAPLPRDRLHGPLGQLLLILEVIPPSGEITCDSSRHIIYLQAESQQTCGFRAPLGPCVSTTREKGVTRCPSGVPS